MTATRDPDRLMRAWLDLMPDEAPDRVISSVLQAAQHTRQVRVPPWAGRWRHPLNRLSLVFAVIALGAVMVGGAIMFGGGGRGPVGPSLAPSATPSPQASGELAAPPDTLIWGDWIADVEAIPGIQQPAGRIQLSVDWEAGLEVWIQQDVLDQRWVVQSVSYPAAANELRVRASSTVGCAAGDEGRYAWTRSADGLFLTLELIEDACATRATLFARTWVHSHGAVNDGGPGVNYAVTPAIQMTLPTGQRYAMSGGEGAPEIKTFGDAQPFRAFVIVQNPGGFEAPCSTTDTRKVDIAHTTDAFVTYVESLPGATVTTSNASIGSRPAFELQVTIDAGVECASGSIEAFRPERLSDTFSWTFAPGEVQTLYIVEMDASTTFLLWYQGPVAETQGVLDSIEFIDELPAP